MDFLRGSARAIEGGVATATKEVTTAVGITKSEDDEVIEPMKSGDYTVHVSSITFISYAADIS